ncbi:MASE1 domain-containing protein [Nocardioides zeae]
MTPEAEPGRARAGAWATTTLTETGRRALVAGAVATSFCLAYAAVTLAPAGSGVASWWPAAGVSTAALLVARRWRWVALALALTTCSANVLAGRPLVLAVIFGLANAVEAVLVAEVLTRRRTAPARLDGVRDVARLMGLPRPVPSSWAWWRPPVWSSCSTGRSSRRPGRAGRRTRRRTSSSCRSSCSSSCGRVLRTDHAARGLRADPGRPLVRSSA